MYAPTAFPFTCYVEGFDALDGWTREAEGTSYAWLADRLAEARATYGRARLIAYWGDEVELPA
jgi:hypothetical protein